ncbi:ABC transporter ATP-binding protein [Paenibacillus agilis]|uniref:ABC transporter ATP-binding protein n=1 Tax=Paenibacillus agilis TaxID=3020863 RepID=A0A559J0Z2_9BACL|nr:ABC transporter ATP-binding protein [Paenibacillus agilis]TVX93555.1 ABC transporter ATP-binding protein [Paenibacillus agilis]
MKKDDNHFGILDSIRFLRVYLKNYKISFVLFAIGWMLEGLLQLLLPVLFGVLIDEMVYYKNIDVFLDISLVIMIFSLFLCTLYFVIYTYFNQIVGKYTFDIKMDLYDHLLSVKNNYVDDSRAGDIITTIQNYTHECVLIITRNLVYTIYCTLMILLFSTYIFFVNWKIGVLFMVFAPISTYITLKSGKKIRGYSNQYRSVYGSYIGWLFEMLNGKKDVRLLGAQNIVRKMFTRRHKELFSLEIKKNMYSLNLTNSIEIVNVLMQVSIFGFGAYLASKGDLTVGALIVIIAFFAEINSNILFLHGYYVDLQDRLTAVKYIKNFKDLPTESEAGERSLVVHDGEIEFQDVQFTYSSENILNNLSLHIKAGEKVAIVGKSGSGKSTLANMLIAFLKPSKGNILIDGQQLSDCSHKSIRSCVGVVQQSVLMFDGTIRENIRLGNLKATDIELLEVCEKTGIMEFVNSLEKGLDTVIGSKGVSLSGGQKQMIAITRIFLKNPKIIIFDEATSSLDMETESRLHESWSKAFTDRTIIVISHNLASVKLCDRVILCEGGQVIEEGEPNEMHRTSQRYRELFSLNM